MFCSHAVQTSPEVAVLVSPLLNLPGLACHLIKNYGSRIVLNSGHGFGLCAESHTVVLDSELHRRVLSWFLYLQCFLYAIVATVSEQPALCKLQSSLGDFLCLADSRCFARVYFWVSHEPISDFPVCVCLNTNEELFSYEGPGQLPSSPTPFLPPPEKMFIFQVLDLLQTPFLLSTPPALTNLVPFLHGMQSSLRF